MTAEEIKHTLDILHKQKIAEKIKWIVDNLHNIENYTYFGFGYGFGLGCYITYNPQTNMYAWRDYIYNGFTGKYGDAFEISEADFIAKLNTQYEKFEAIIAEDIQHILDTLHNIEHHKYRYFGEQWGSSWSGYTREGYEVIYYPQTNSYTWEDLADLDYAGIRHFGAVEISEADLVSNIITNNYTI